MASELFECICARRKEKGLDEKSLRDCFHEYLERRAKYTWGRTVPWTNGTKLDFDTIEDIDWTGTVYIKAECGDEMLASI